MAGISGIWFLLLATTYVLVNMLAKVSVVFAETVIHSSRKCLGLGRVMYGLKTHLKLFIFMIVFIGNLCHGYFCYRLLYYVVVKFNSKH
jgi:hypothetical protein